MGSYRIYYARPEFRRAFCFGFDAAKRDGAPIGWANLTKTHAFVREIETPSCPGAASCEEIYAQCQGEVWSPNGEARELIQSLGLVHTSMSVGDIMVWIDGDEAMMFMVDGDGFTCISGSGRFDDILGTGKPFLTVRPSYGLMKVAVERGLDIYHQGFRGYVKLDERGLEILKRTMDMFVKDRQRGPFLGAAEYRVGV